jgi:hypothetical protein
MATSVTSYCMAASITHFVTVEVIKRPVSTVRMWTNVAMVGIESIINMAVKIVRAMEPRASPDEDAAVEPLRSVIPVWGTAVRSKIVVAVWASRLCSNIDRNPSGGGARDTQQSDKQRTKNKQISISHKFLATEKSNPDAKLSIAGSD